MNVIPAGTFRGTAMQATSMVFDFSSEISPRYSPATSAGWAFAGGTDGGAAAAVPTIARVPIRARMHVRTDLSWQRLQGPHRPSRTREA